VKFPRNFKEIQNLYEISLKTPIFPGKFNESQVGSGKFKIIQLFPFQLENHLHFSTVEHVPQGI